MKRTMAVMAFFILTIGLPVQAQTEEFLISYGETVSDGSPAPGAGNLEAAGDTDVYRFEAEVGDHVIFDVLAGTNLVFRWRLEGPDGITEFDSSYNDLERIIPKAGTYTLTVYGRFADSTGTYSFRVLVAPEPEEFTIALGDTIGNGVPVPGAGNIEVPGAVDLYRFDGVAGQRVILDVIAVPPSGFNWRLRSPGGQVIFSSIMTDREAILPETGVYTLTVSGLTPTGTGVYSFSPQLAPVLPEEFDIAIGDTIGDGVPAPGAGSIEVPGAVDLYRFDGADGQLLDFDVISSPASGLWWVLTAPDGSVSFDGIVADLQLTLPATGEYVLSVSGLTVAGVGTYSFTIRPSAPPNTSPTVDAIADQVSQVGDVVALQVVATDADGDALTFAAVGLPLGLAIDPSTGLIEGTLEPGSDAASPYATEVTVTDPSGAAATGSLRWTVHPASVEPDALTVEIDLPLSCIFVNGFGVIPVVVYGSPDVNVRQIDYATMRLEGMGVLRIFGRPMVVYGDFDGDPYEDALVMIKETRGALQAGQSEATLTGELRDGTKFSGTDDICIWRR